MNHPHTTTSRPTTEWTLLIFEALQKAVEIIWRARLPVSDQPQSVVQPPQPGHASPSSSSSSRRSRLNLEVEEVEYVRQRMSGWKETLHTPVVVDLYFVETDPLGRTYKDLVERWYLFFDPTTGPDSPLSSKRDASASAAAVSAHLKRAQKRLTFMLRTLYSFLRMAPPFQLVRRLSEAAPDCTSHLEANLNPGLASGLREDMTRLLEDGETYQTYRFTDISTPYGTLKATVVYRTQCDFEVATRPSPAPLIQPSQIIEGYVQGPRADQPPPPPQPPQPRGASGLTRAMQLHEAQNQQQQHRQPQPPQPVVQQQPRHRPPMHPPLSPQDRHMYHQRRSSAPSASPPFRHHHHGHASDPRDIPGGMAEDRNHHHHQQMYGRSFKSTSPLGRLDGDLRARSLDSAIPTLMKDYRVGLERGSSAGFTASTYHRPDSHRYGSSPQSPLLGLTTSRTKGFTPPSSASGWQMMQDDRRSVPQHIRRYSSSSLPDDPPVEEDEYEEEEETTRATRGRVVGESPHSTPLRPGVTPSSLSTPPFSSSYTNTVENEAIPPFSLGCSPPFASHLSSLLSRSPQQPPPPSPPFMRNPASADSNYNQRTHCLPVNTGLGSFTNNPNTTTPTFSSSAGRYTGGFASSTSPSMDMVRVGGGGGSASTTPTKPLSGVTGGLSPSSYHMAYSTPIGPMLESLGDSPFKLSGNSASLLRPGSSSAFGGLSSKYSNICPSSGSISQGGGSRLSNRQLALTSFECMEGEARAFKKPLGLGVSQGPRPMTSDTGAYVNDATGDAEEDLPFAARGPPEPLQSTSRPSSSFTQTSVPLSLSTPAPMVNTSISTLRGPRFTTSSSTTTGGSSVLSTTPITASSLNPACSQQQAGGLGLLDALEEDLRSFQLFRDEFNRPLPQPHTTDH